MTFDERYEQLAQEGRIYGEIEKEKIRLLDVPQIRDEIIATLKGIPDLTCELCDALDALGYCSSESAIPAHEIAPLTPSQVAVGVAVTTRSCPEQVYNIHEHESRQAHLYQKVLPFLKIKNAFWVAEAKGCTCSHFGDNTARLHRDCGMVGTLVDGYIRDGESIKKVGYPFWSRGLTPMSGKRRLEVVEINGVVSIGHVQVRPGDLVAADGSGIVIVPHAIVEEVFARLQKSGLC